MNEAQQRRLVADSGCEVRFDDLTRQLFATDASIYQIEPVGVAFPRSAAEAARVLQAAMQEGIPVIPRGAGTGLAGGAVGSGLIIDFSRHNRAILDFDAERHTVRVEAGVVLDQLNAYLQPHGLCFGPDVAPSSRATLGGMIANNSSGARAPLYGTTTDHVESLDIVMTDGKQITIGADHDTAPEIRVAIDTLLRQHATFIDERMPIGLVKGWPGYGIDRWLRDRADLTRILGGSEGTLAAITSAELRVSPLPNTKRLGVLFFASVLDAMEATTDILDLKPAAVEHVDRVLFDQTRGQLAFERARALLRLDEEPCEAFLIVEFYDDTDGRLETLMDRNLGIRRASFTGPDEMEHIWRLRKAGLSLLTGCKGDAKPTAGIEDVAVTPQRLPEYVRGLQGLFDSRGLEGSFYGHAAAGLLHIRPVVDLHKQEDLETYRSLADEVSALTRQLRGSIAGEHGVGIARTEYLPEHLGPELMDVTERIKALFDPKNLMNPGKIVGDGRYTIDTNLRQGARNRIELPFEPVLAFAAKDESFIGNLEQCNGCGGCRKDAPTMCPTFIATGEEIMSTRGRASTIRAVLEHRLDADASPLRSAELEAALKYCLSCKACTTECPSNVNMALLKAELIHARHREHGLPLRERVLSRVDLLGALGTSMPRLANAVLGLSPVRALMETTLGISAKRPLPDYTAEQFDRWFARRNDTPIGSRGKVMLWDDCFVRYNEPEIGKAAVFVLEAAGYEVVLPSDRACCGRPAFSTGRLDLAAEFGRVNLELLHAGDDLPIVFLEPSCYAMFAEDYRELGLTHAADIGERAFLFETFIEDLLERDADALPFKEIDRNIAVHIHCHAKSLVATERSVAPARRIPGAEVTLLQTGCCGMAGAFGASRDTYEMSRQVAAPLVEQVQALPEGTHLIASGTSCRHQIRDLAGVEAQHMAQVLAAALDPL